MLFESITKIQRYEDVPIVLLLNKLDLLEERMLKTPIAEYYADYSGDPKPLTACRFFADKLSELDRRLHGSLRILAISAVNPNRFVSTIEELWSDLFQH